MSGCYPENFISDDVEGEKLAKELLTYLSEDDAEGMKSMFCDRAKESSELDRQIEEALVFFDGSVITEDPQILVSGGKAMDNGRVTWLRVSPSIEGVETDTGKSYKILFYDYLVCANEKDIVGISEIRIESSGGEVFTIGEYIEKA
jgi:hypothetical protein